MHLASTRHLDTAAFDFFLSEAAECLFSSSEMLATPASAASAAEGADPSSALMPKRKNALFGRVPMNVDEDLRVVAVNPQFFN